MDSVSGLLLGKPNVETDSIFVSKNPGPVSVDFQNLLLGLSQMNQMKTSIAKDEVAELNSILKEEITNIDETILATILEFIQLQKNSVDIENLQHLLMEEFSIDSLTAQQLIAQTEISAENDVNQVEESLNFNIINPFLVDNLTDESLQQLQLLVNEVSQLLQRLDLNLDSLKEISSRILLLLEQWTKLNGQEKLTVQELFNENLSDDEQQLWQRLVNVYEKRQQYSEYGNYRTHATVTRTDVMNWLQQFTPELMQRQEYSPIGSTDLGRSMTEVEQYVLHVRGTERIERISNEFMREFMTIINQSRFSKLDNNLTELSIIVRPENLGNMTLRFTQMDGEMVVKIIVSSQMAKNLLETNTHQLKHLFAPHQVIIERDESVTDEQFFNEDQMGDEPHDDDSMNETNEDNDSQQENQSDIDFESLLQATVEGGLR